MLVTALISLYLSSLLIFSFVSHPVVYCLLLLSSAIGASGFTYLLLGASWYLVIFCLVYVGGVYVLFVFVSIHNPNPSLSVGGTVLWLLVSFFFVFFFFWAWGLTNPVFVEGSHYLCSFFEGFSYCLFCLVLMVGFISISVVVGEKDSFFR